MLLVVFSSKRGSNVIQLLGAAEKAVLAPESSVSISGVSGVNSGIWA